MFKNQELLTGRSNGHNGGRRPDVYDALPDNLDLLSLDYNNLRPPVVDGDNYQLGVLIQDGIRAELLTNEADAQDKNSLQAIIDLGVLAAKQLAENNIPLVMARASTMLARWNNIDPDDVISAGLLGLVRAAKRYNPARGEFSTYARFFIDDEIRKEAIRVFATRSHAVLYPHRDEQDGDDIFERIRHPGPSVENTVELHFLIDLFNRLFRKISEFVNTLNPRDRFIFLQLFSEGKTPSNSEIANLLESNGFYFSGEWVRRQRHRIIKLLITYFEQDPDLVQLRDLL